MSKTYRANDFDGSHNQRTVRAAKQQRSQRRNQRALRVFG